MPEAVSGVRPAALVTGGAQRIGRAIALALAQRGYAVAVQFSLHADVVQLLTRKP